MLYFLLIKVESKKYTDSCQGKCKVLLFITTRTEHAVNLKHEFNVRCLSSLCLHLVDPGSVDIDRRRQKNEVLSLQHLLDDGTNQLAEYVLTSLSSSVVDDHLDDCWVACHNVHDLIDFGTERRGEKETLDYNL